MSRPLDVSALLRAHNTAITFSEQASSTGCSSTSDRTLQAQHNATHAAQCMHAS